MIQALPTWYSMQQLIRNRLVLKWVVFKQQYFSGVQKTQFAYFGVRKIWYNNDLANSLDPGDNFSPQMADIISYYDYKTSTEESYI